MLMTRGSRIKTAVASRFGGYSPFMRWYRTVRPRWLWRMTSPYGAATTRYVKENGLKVKRGPFVGLTFPPRALGHANYLASKLAGSYEPDVLDFIEDQVGASDIFVDLGSGDGFFCAGVAKIGEVKVIGYETNSFERRLALDLARVNRVEMDIRGLATPRELDTLPEGRLLLLSDVEGFEEDLLDPEECERLKAATLVVEVHEMIRPNVVRVRKERFDGTHTITRVFAQVSDVGNFSELEAWGSEPASFALSDGHSEGNSWLMMKPKV